MKKFVGIVMALVMVLACAIAHANDDPIWDDVYDAWKEENNNIYETFLNTTYYSDGFEKNNMAWMAAYNVYLNAYECMTTKEMEDELKKQFDMHYGTDSTVVISVIGHNEYYDRDVLEIIVNVDTDLRKIEDTNLDEKIYTEPVLGMYLICYDKY